MSSRLSYDDSDMPNTGAKDVLASAGTVREPDVFAKGNITKSSDAALAFDLLSSVDRANLNPVRRGQAVLNETYNNITLTAPPTPNKWDNITQLPINNLSNQICEMHPQFSALLLSRLPHDTTREILAQIPEALSGDVFSRLVTLKSPSSQAIALLENEFFDAMANQADTYDNAGESDTAFINLIYDMPAATQTAFINQLGKADGTDLLRHLERQNLEILGNYSQHTIQTLFYEAELSNVATALAGHNMRALDIFLSALSSRAQTQLSTRMQNQAQPSEAARIAAQLDLMRFAPDLQTEPNIFETDYGEPLAEILV